MKTRFLADKQSIMGLVVWREGEGLLRETDKKEFNFRGIESKIVVGVGRSWLKMKLFT